VHNCQKGDQAPISQKQINELLDAEAEPMAESETSY